MKTIKVIDLLNKIANGEVPKKIKVNNKFTYTHDGIDYKNHDGTYLFDSYIETTPEDMNIEVEILEEEKKLPEKLNLDTDELRGKETPRAIDYLIESKINQVIDYLESKEKGE